MMEHNTVEGTLAITDGQRIEITGQVELIGKPTGVGRYLRQVLDIWQAADVYSTAVAQVFFREELVPLLRQKGLRSNGLELKAGTVPQTVDVTINVGK